MNHRQRPSAVEGEAEAGAEAGGKAGIGGRRVDAHGDDLRYMQVCRRLEADILTGRFASGARLAPERELGARLGVARNTLRRALLLLASRGLLEPLGRRGWVVTAVAVTERVNGPQGLTDWGARQGFVVTSRVLASRLRPAAAAEAARIRVAPGEAVFELERVRLVDGVPLSLDRSILHPRLARFLDGVDFTTASLYATLHERAAVVPTLADVVLRAVIAEPRAADLLELAEGDALLELTETVFDQYDEPFETATLLNRGDRYAFGTTLTAATGLPRVEVRPD
jgi:DNA-binding GntR family transcriptional regulator